MGGNSKRERGTEGGREREREKEREKKNKSHTWIRWNFLDLRWSDREKRSRCGHTSTRNASYTSVRKERQ